jgi:hypothetical protein
MSNKQQTAVEWLIERLLDLDIQFAKKLISLDVHSTTKVYLQEKAKEMEKVQIKDAFGVGCQVESTRLIGYHKMSEQYYNETYGGNK